MSTVHFSCTSLVGTDKKGIITPNANGYYRMPVGGLNVFNSAGHYYVLEGARKLFENSSSFMRRVKRGALRGEVGHPQQLPGQSLDDFANRILTIVEANVCVHFSDIYLDFDNFKDQTGKPIVGIMADLTPSGPKGDALARSLANPKENVCFSIRSFTEDRNISGIRHRKLDTIVTFDYVNEPGIAHAEKFKAPGLESLVEKTFTRTQMERATAPERQTLTLGMESRAISREELFESFGWKQHSAPKYMQM